MGVPAVSTCCSGMIPEAVLLVGVLVEVLRVTVAIVGAASDELCCTGGRAV